MTQTAYFPVNCADCGHSFGIEAWDVLDANSSPLLKEKVLNGSIFNRSCPKCAFTNRVVHNCLYYDLHKRFAVMLEPGNLDREKAHIPGVIPFTGGWVLRLTADVNAFIEKVNMLERGYNDKAFELLRAIVRTYLQQAVPDVHIERLHAVLNDPGKICFQGISGNRQQLRIAVPESAYSAVWDAVSGRLRTCAEPNKFISVDAVWLKSHEGAETLKTARRALSLEALAPDITYTESNRPKLAVVCHKCGRELLPHSTFCIYCGAATATDRVEAKPLAKPAMADTCAVCGETLLPRSEFCIYCGAKAPAVICTGCNAEYPYGTEVCKRCGMLLKPQTQSDTAAGGIKAGAVAPSDLLYAVEVAVPKAGAKENEPAEAGNHQGASGEAPCVQAAFNTPEQPDARESEFDKIIKRLEQLGELKQKGILTDDEFAQAKKALIAKV